MTNFFIAQTGTANPFNGLDIGRRSTPTFADLDGDGQDELVIGVRDDPNPKLDKFSERRGVRLYKRTDATGQKWERFVLDNGGVAVEDLITADLNADGKPDIIAVGRATGNCRIYWNQGK